MKDGDSEYGPAQLLRVIHHRKKDPVPFFDCGGLPWSDPEVSRRLLEIHLSQKTDQASRREEIIAGECAFLDSLIRGRLGEGRRILDIGCGPGLYAMELARYGHLVVGVDFGPAVIDYARDRARAAPLPIEYILGDIRHVEFPPQSFDVCFFNYAMPNTHSRPELIALTEKIAAWLRPGGIYISELMTIEGLQSDLTREWDTFERSAFADGPHLWLDEKIWHEPTQSQVYRIFVIDLTTGRVSRYEESHQGYSPGGYSALLKSRGLAVAEVYGDMNGEPLKSDSHWAVFVAVKSKAS